jgi:RHS repeat-associated protein
MPVEKYIYDGDTLLQVTDGSGVTQKEYTSTMDRFGDVLSEFDGSSAKCYEPDGLGSTDALSDASQTVTDQWRYRAFGAATHTTGTDSNPFTWAGRQGNFNDAETGLYFLRTRYYDQVTAQFLSQDPIGFDGGDANLYRFVGNNPVNMIDPSGLKQAPWPPLGPGFRRG